MGDILIAEPVVAVLRETYDHVTLFTDYGHVARLLDVFEAIRPYDEHLLIKPGDFDRTLCLKYEIYPGTNHLDGYALNAGVVVVRRVPLIRRRFPQIVTPPYGLIAPTVSDWIRPMREWALGSFRELAQRLSEMSTMPVLMLDTNRSFDEMLSLIQHCTFFVGNDSGPAILAQCFSKPTFVVFGATHPRLILLSADATGLLKDVGCNGCKHHARHTDIECAVPLCLSELTVDDVVAQMCHQGWPYSHGYSSTRGGEQRP